MGTHPVPPEIVRRFANKTMAIVGYEMDQVMVQPTGKPGVHPEKDVSVPINWACTWPTPALARSWLP